MRIFVHRAEDSRTSDSVFADVRGVKRNFVACCMGMPRSLSAYKEGKSPSAKRDVVTYQAACRPIPDRVFCSEALPSSDEQR